MYQLHTLEPSQLCGTLQMPAALAQPRPFQLWTRQVKPAASEATVHTAHNVPPTRTFLPFPPMTALNPPAKTPAKAKRLTVERPDTELVGSIRARSFLSCLAVTVS